MRLLALSFLLAASSAAAVAAPTNCKALRSPSARLACYEKQDPAEERGTGTAEGTITWQYNAFVGTKGDVGARVIFVRDPFEITVAKMEDVESKMLSGGFRKPESVEKGVYSTQVDGFGKYTLDGIPTGTYSVFIFSSKTRPGLDDAMTNYCKDKVGSFFQSFVFVLSKSYCTTTKVTAGRPTTVSHDFGNTYF